MEISISLSQWKCCEGMRANTQHQKWGKNLSVFTSAGIRCQQYPKDCRVGLFMGPGWAARQKDQTCLRRIEVHVLRRVLRLCGTCCSLILTTSVGRMIHHKLPSPTVLAVAERPITNVLRRLIPPQGTCFMNHSKPTNPYQVV